MDTMAEEGEVVEVGGQRFRFDRATREDVPAIVAMLADDPLGSGRESGVEEAGYRAAFDAIDVDPAHLLVVVRDRAGEPAGTMQLTLLPGLSRGGATRLQIEAVRIAAAYRGHGLGTAMIEWAHEHGRRNGARLVQLTTDNSRTDAHRFYERLGYRASHVGMKRPLD
ncbi:GNAT family N-acetyltransferase [Enemella evansiae]|nr:GNAT family N-acetyltransferase [Enemella evansiae]TDO92510.1 acetyltransferase (GNAT) family protein [Enemella evansiae]